MRLYFLILMVGLLGTTACNRKSAEIDRVRFATIREIMHTMVDPSGDFVFESVQQISDDKGIHEKAPKSDSEWNEVRHHLTVLQEASELITMESRKVGRPEDTSENPAVELEPAESQKLIDGDRSNFIRRARRLNDAASFAMKAVDAKDKTALLGALDRVDKACESCHLKYWYPNDKAAQQAAKLAGLTEE